MTNILRKISIDPKDISVVVQGAVDARLTPLCLASIRQYLPGAEIILSTWRGTETKGLDYDILVLNRDPGCSICDEQWNVKNNVNRQIISTKNGLKKVQRRYALKLRTDISLTSLNFLRYWKKFPKRTDDCRVLTERVLINNLYCANPHKTNFCFHVSDWVFFGLTEDLLKIWNIPSISVADSVYFKGHPRPKIDPIPTWLFRWIPEQYIWTSCLLKSGQSFVFNHFTDISSKNLYESELSFANNVVIINYEDFGINFMKFDPYKWDYSAQYTHKDWLQLYKQYCDPKFIMPYKIYIAPDIERLYHHYKCFFQPIEKMISKGRHWIEELFHIMGYIIKILSKSVYYVFTEKY
ncbi:WavE lipopolysaccharide synthesis family protein [Candidatus Avelusimicrobium caledoniensis]|uniref:WavE lipopolysaccharide synthesis family protein n=1 Tax=Candidatus Avelusimicrobium caledoniensis TaxID=3416220 RepID=UPI003D13F379